MVLTGKNITVENVMKMTFRGWSREVYSHKHDVAPVVMLGSNYVTGKVPDILVKDGEVSFQGKVTGLGLKGDFLVKFTLSDDDLNELVQKKVLQNPIESLAYVADLQAQVLKAALHAKLQPSSE